MEHTRFVARNFKDASPAAKRRALLVFAFMLFVVLPLAAVALTAVGWAIQAVF